ncbi:DNA-3-methyladenine glycosylase I [Paenibacillus alkalitolerans]|uniref:DNA-3-methyladenine glycosylase I n=1 Tax=Paenibacillus alkalitolerans TaxID=2799335 RepID=UPI0018F7C60C|nr:DNA-3-methyladenine glycosylase I [Paenibacillus alkalitolerans]
MTRCAWTTSDPLYIQYHDREWGVPVYDDRLLFEYLVLEGAQAGLNWLTILKKRDNYRIAFDNFEPAIVAAYDEAKVEELLTNPGIVRNRLKVKSAIRNANAVLNVQDEFGSFSEYIWSFVGGTPLVNHWEGASDVPARTPESDAMSKSLSKRGFSFVGSTICYAFMQATGMVMDHTKNCFRYAELTGK